MERLPRICVIMSTYNGEKYIREQIESILAQKEVEVTLHIYDDLSKDKTVEIAREYESERENVKVHINEKNKNFTYNFLDALFSYKDIQEYEYYAFSDQDDYWVENKLINAINKIREKGRCTLYSSNLKVVDENLKYSDKNMMDMKYKNRHYDVLCKNIVTGCTIVMDNEFKNLVAKHYPENIYLHDYWLAFIACYVKGANYVYDINPNNILYRQHGGNLIGSGSVNLKKKEYYKTTGNLVKEFVRLYGDEILEDDIEIFKRLSNIEKFKNRFYLFFKIKSNTSHIFKAKLILKRY